MYSFSPYFEQSALYLNPFEQGEGAHHGLLETAQQLLSYLSIDLDLNRLVSDHTTVIYANFFAMRFALWRQWLALTEAVYEIARSEDKPLARRLNSQTRHRGVTSYPLKVFLIERIITVFLEARGLSAKLCIDPENSLCLLSIPPGLRWSLEACDALKGQYRRCGIGSYLTTFLNLRSSVFAQLGATPRRPQGESTA